MQPIGAGSAAAKRGRRGGLRAGLAVTLIAGILSVALPTVTAPPAAATYATGGSGLYLSTIDWFDWGTNDIAVSNGLSRSNSRTIGGSVLTTTCTLTSEIGDVRTYRPGQWQGDSLDNLYNIGGTDSSNQLVSGLYNFRDGQRVGFDVSCSVTLDGVPVPVQGLVVADAEASNDYPNTPVLDEYLEVTPLQPATWRVIDRFRDCDTSVIAQLSATGTLRLGPDNIECTYRTEDGSGPMVVGFMDGATSARVLIQGGGRSAIAIGAVVQADFGDAPASYGGAGAVYDGGWSGGTIPVGSTNVSASGFALATPTDPTLRLGATIDADSSPNYSANATADDLLLRDDEDAVGPLPPASALPGSIYTTNVACNGVGFVAGWIDWNRNGLFDTGERSNTPACVAGTVALSWTVPAGVVSGDSFLRLRIADTVANLVPIGVRVGGEVEDHALRVNPTITLQKSYPNGRLAPSDQTLLGIRTGLTPVGPAATTTGAESGVQNQAPSEYVGPTAAVVGTSYTISESMAPGSVNAAGDYSSSWSCVDNFGTQVTSGSGTTGAFTMPNVTVQRATGIVCTFTNTAAPVSLAVTKNWIVDGVAYANGAQPVGLAAALSLTTQGTTTPTPQAWGTPRPGYVRGSAATITESTQLQGVWAGCEATADVTQLNGAPIDVPLTTSGYAVTLDRLATSAQITNTVQCSPAIALEKFATVVDADGDGRTGLGDHIFYTFTVTNTGDVTVNNLAISDDLLFSVAPLVNITITCNATSIAPDQQTTCVADTAKPYVIDQADVDAGIVINTAFATGTDHTNRPVRSNDDSTETLLDPTFVPVQIEKIGEDVNGAWTRMDGSSWAILADDDGVPGAELAVTIDPVTPGIGLFEVNGLTAGTYWLSEVTAPDGFSLLAQSVKFVVTAPSLLVPDPTVTITANGGTTATAQGALITVRDVPALTMPTTGGTGATPFLDAGATLLLIAAAFAVALRRRESHRSE